VPEPLAVRRHLIATKRELLHLSDRGLRRLLPGQFYGLSVYRDHWYAFEKLGDHGRLLCFQLDNGRLRGLREIATGLSGGCHQIDWIGDRLWVADTYENRLLVFELSGDGLTRAGEVAPFGRLEAGRDSDNYVHLNSLWSEGDGLYAVLHNETTKTGRHSEIIHLDDEGRIMDRIATPSGHAHNVVRYRGRLLHCDSQAGALRWGNDIVFRADRFTRGLSLSAGLIVVGGSAYSSREARGRLPGALYVLDEDFQERARMELPAMVQEVRALDESDLGLSNPVKPAGQE
jgi:hypothetical protein